MTGSTGETRRRKEKEGRKKISKKISKKVGKVEVVVEEEEGERELSVFQLSDDRDPR